MNMTVWLPPVLAAVVTALLSPGLVTALRALASAEARRVMYVPVPGDDLYRNGVPLTEAQFREVFSAYRAELDTLAPPAERNAWEAARKNTAFQRLAVLTGTHPCAFPNLGDVDQAWEWYRDNNRYAAGDLSSHRLRLSPPGDIVMG